MHGDSKMRTGDGKNSCEWQESKAIWEISIHLDNTTKKRGWRIMGNKSISLRSLLRSGKKRLEKYLNGSKKYKPGIGRNRAGYFLSTDRRIDIIRFANWGSRPYEYSWVLDIVHELNVKKMRILDMGTGQPSVHGWPEYVSKHLSFDQYVGIDIADELETIVNTDPKFKLMQMDMTKLEFEDRKFNLCLCISTFEHLSSLDALIQCFKETHRVLEDDSYLIVTLDEIWDCKKINKEYSPWNLLELSLIKDGKGDFRDVSFGLKDFMEYIAPYFKPVNATDIRWKANKDQGHLFNEYWNSTVSYCVFIKVNTVAIRESNTI
jgi:ubiquinone/menaquinone biosynthesis C-methylase UbiE